MNRVNLKPFTEDCWLAAALQANNPGAPAGWERFPARPREPRGAAPGNGL